MTDPNVIYWMVRGDLYTQRFRKILYWQPNIWLFSAMKLEDLRSMGNRLTAKEAKQFQIKESLKA